MCWPIPASPEQEIALSPSPPSTPPAPPGRPVHHPLLFNAVPYVPEPPPDPPLPPHHRPHPFPPPALHTSPIDEDEPSSPTYPNLFTFPPEPTTAFNICPNSTSTPNFVVVYPPPPPPFECPISPKPALDVYAPPPLPPPTQKASIFFTPFGTVNVVELSD